MPIKLIQRVEPTPVSTLVNHVLVSGKSGSGKSNLCEWMCTQYLEKGGTKIVDIYDSGRFENMLYGLPEDDPAMIVRTMNISGQEPKAFPNQIIAFPGKQLSYRSKLPANVRLMSFDIDDLDLNDLFYLLGASDKLEGVLATISNSVGDHVNMRDIYDILVSRKYRGTYIKLPNLPVSIHQMAQRNIRRWMTSGIFSDEVEKIDFQKILSDTSTITSFSTFLQETEEEEVMVYGLILKKINDLKKRRFVQPRVRVYFREISEAFKREWALPRKYILEFLRQGRDRGIDLICDTQRAFDLDSKYRRQFGLFIGLKTDFSDAEKFRDFQADIPSRYLKKAPSWGAGEGILLTGISWEYPMIFPPTRHKHKKPNLDVMDILGSTFGWQEFSDEQVKKILGSEIVEPLEMSAVKEHKKEEYYGEY